MRVFAISDVHTDFRDNLWQLAQLSTHGYREDALILAGDVSHDLGILRRTLGIFLDRFRHVFFVPGNHELWIRADEYRHSVEKFHEVLRLCESVGVHTGPEVIGAGEDRVCVVPLFSWYAKPADGSDSLYRERPIAEPTESVWTDDYLVKWPGSGGFRPVQFFLDMNGSRVNAQYAVNRISFSHFLPRQDLMFPAAGDPAAGDPAAGDPAAGEARAPGPAPPPHPSFNFSRVAGSTLIEQQIRKLGSRVHVYGHQHRNRCRNYDGVWYVSNCLGYPDERGGRAFQSAAAILKAVWPEPALQAP